MRQDREKEKETANSLILPTKTHFDSSLLTLIAAVARFLMGLSKVHDQSKVLRTPLSG